MQCFTIKGFRELTNLFCECYGDGANWKSLNDNGPHEANFLKLDTTKIKSTFGWEPRWHMDTTMKMIIEWTKVYFKNEEEIPEIMDKQINDFFGGK